MRARAYYNEIEPAAAHLLRALIDRNIIAPGEVDTRSIKDVQPDDLMGFTQCHFFAGGGIWSVAARLAGWPDERPLWTGSCPCQPFSVAGKGRGADDPRHLWPDFFRLIRECRPPVVVGEQVSAAAGKRRLITQDMLEMLRRERFERFLKGQFGSRWALFEMQGLSERGGFGSELDGCGESENQSAQAGLLETRAHQGAYFAGAASSGEQGPSVRFGSVRGRAGHQDEARALRNDGHAFQPRWRADMGQSVNRQNQSGGRLHDHELSAGSSGSERDDERLGRAEGGGDCRSVQGQGGCGAEWPDGSIRSSAEREAGTDWLDRVFLDLDEIGYASRAVDIPACAVDAPHIRQRLYWVSMADAARERWGEGRPGHEFRSGRPAIASAGSERELADATSGHASAEWQQRSGQYGFQPEDRRDRGIARDDERRSFWRDAELRIGADGKARRVKPGVRLLVDGLPGRVGLLRIGGNAIVAQQAAEVIAALMDVLPFPTPTRTRNAHEPA